MFLKVFFEYARRLFQIGLLYFITHFLGPMSTILSGELKRPIISLQPSVTSRSRRCSLNRSGRQPHHGHTILRYNTVYG